MASNDGIANQKYELVAVDTLHTHPDNPRQGDVGAISVSIGKLKFYGACIVQKSTRRILAGNHRYLAAVANGLEEVPVIWIDCDDDAARRILLVDNRTSDIAAYDDNTLAALLTELAGTDAGLVGTGYDGDDLDALLADLSGADPGRNAILEPPADPITQPGDVWTLGTHRLVCGDTFEESTFEALMPDGEEADIVLTDPPFAIYGSSTGVSSEVADDAMVRPFFQSIGRVAYARSKMFAHVYVHCDWRSWSALWDGMKRAGLDPKNMLVWDKGDYGMGTNWGNAHELIAYFAKLPRQGAMRGSRKTGQRSVSTHVNILRFPRVAGEEREHNAAKPVELLATILTNASDTGAIVLDPFGGSGSTLIAAETTHRHARLVEKEPSMCDVICARFQRETGELPMRNGEAVNFPT